MNGIVVEEYQNVFDKDTVNLDNLNSSIDSLISSFNDIKNFVNSNEGTKFLAEPIIDTINQLNNVRDNFKEYHQILSSVYAGYKKQSDKISNSIESILPND